jgi:hypothetical protein
VSDNHGYWSSRVGYGWCNGDCPVCVAVMSKGVSDAKRMEAIIDFHESVRVLEALDRLRTVD